ncbi:MAG: FKBP-type peptidyl-prolyl cis-trans isomerase [Chitinispirillales bacterium]|nr:FKBP-type peptidyl-prolyl cis-trans isomerase [Chitinispirillales bacterium]
MSVKKLKFAVFTAAAVSAVLLASCEGGTQGAAIGKVKPKFDPADSTHQISYVVGNDLGKRLKEMDADLDMMIVLMAFREAAEGAPAQLSDSTIAAVDRQFKRSLRDRERQRRQQLEGDNLTVSQALLEQNRGNAGVIVTESGLQYQFLKESTGPKPKATDMVRIHYHGTLPDGTVFDSSRERGEPTRFAVTGALKGWTEVLQLMPVGSKVKTVIPPELAYGRRGARTPVPVGPNTALTFEIELVAIE